MTFPLASLWRGEAGSAGSVSSQAQASAWRQRLLLALGGVAWLLVLIALAHARPAGRRVQHLGRRRRPAQQGGPAGGLDLRPGPVPVRILGLVVAARCGSGLAVGAGPAPARPSRRRAAAAWQCGRRRSAAGGRQHGARVVAPVPMGAAAAWPCRRRAGIRARVAVDDLARLCGLGRAVDRRRWCWGRRWRCASPGCAWPTAGRLGRQLA